MRKWPERKTQCAAQEPARSFEKFDNCRFAIHHRRFGSRPLFGTARYQCDQQLGNILRIALDGELPGKPEIIVRESEWNGLIVPDAQYGCHFCLFLTSDT